jgi:glutathione S-transferase
MTSKIILYGHGYTPNPIKVAIILEELGLQYTIERVEDKKSDWYASINPNGRVPSIKDLEANITVFEVSSETCKAAIELYHLTDPSLEHVLNI